MILFEIEREVKFEEEYFFVAPNMSAKKEPAELWSDETKRRRKRAKNLENRKVNPFSKTQNFPDGSVRRIDHRRLNPGTLSDR